eukprot:GHVL01016004.1.p1 GENE.GHVL01016004.1~~GHVL01016004.1.p1  ORF type:complete len:106 (-),score=18.43 GHVL01016004.1:62-343(-)
MAWEAIPQSGFVLEQSDPVSVFPRPRGEHEIERIGSDTTMFTHFAQPSMASVCVIFTIIVSSIMARRLSGISDRIKGSQTRLEKLKKKLKNTF